MDPRDGWVRAVNAIFFGFPPVCVLGGQASAIAYDVACDDGGTQEDEDKAVAAEAAVWNGRLAAARTWWKYQKAEHTQETARRQLKQVRLFGECFPLASAFARYRHSPDVLLISAKGRDPYGYRCPLRGLGPLRLFG